MANKSGDKPVQKQLLQNPPGTPIIHNFRKSGVVKNLTLKLTFLLGLISLLVYANTFKNGFVLDDNNVILQNSIVTKGASAIPEILHTPYRRGYYVYSNDLYRPLSLVVFAIEYSFFEKAPLPYHVFNILIFAGCVILLFLFFDQLFERKRTAVAFIASLLFALHPIHTEVVANIKSCDELLCFFFVFLSLNIFIKYAQEGTIIQLLLGGCFYFLSLFSKETTITFLAIIPLIFFFYLNNNRTRSMFISVTVLISSAVFLAIRFYVLNLYDANHITAVNFIDNQLSLSTLSVSSRLATAVLIMGYYVKLLFIPYPLLCNYAYNTIPFVTFSSHAVLISIAIYIFLGVFGIRQLSKVPKSPYAFAVLFYLMTMSLFSNTIFLIGTVMGERLLFLGSAGFCLMAALLLEKLTATTNYDTLTILKNKKVLSVIIPLSIIYAIVTINRNADWIDNRTLYTTDLKKAPDNSWLNNNVAADLLENNPYNLALKENIVY
jgi:hypothetical protein